MEQTAQNLQQQVELYGEPLGEVVRRITGGLGLTQGGLAQVIGLSAPMLSQLVSAHRVKIGNPAVVSRLRAVSELTDLAVSGGIEPGHIAHELDEIRAATGAYTRPTTAHLTRPSQPAAGQPTDPPARFLRPTTYPGELPPSPSARSVVREIQDLFRAVASAEEIQQAAAAVESPAIAELLLAYGTGRTADALAHYEQHHG
jgi:transcriptional regulator with XRE-family HTH domain